MRQKGTYHHTATTHVLFAVMLTALSVGCRRKTHTASFENDSTPSPSPSVSASAKVRQHPTCRLTIPEPLELMPLLRNQVVISRSLHATKLQGSPKLVGEPEDHSEYYLAESAIALETLPPRLARLRGAAIRFLTGPTDCRARLGKIKAWAWADEDGVGWLRDVPGFNAQRVFREGEAFLVAEIESQCEFARTLGVATLNTSDDLRSWTVRALLDETDNPESAALIQRGLVALEAAPALAVQNLAYERYRRRAGGPLPEHWWSLPNSYVYWSYATSGTDALLIAELKSTIAREFSGAWLGVWCLGNDGKLVSLGPDAIPNEHATNIDFYHRHLDVVGPAGALPTVLYSYFALRPVGASYQLYDYSLDAPPRLDR
jgi:hypothetical protein